MKRLILLLVVLSIICANSLSAQNTDSLSAQNEDSLVLQNKYNLHEFLKEGGKYISQPVKWKAINWVTFGLVVFGTYDVWQIDNKIYDNALERPGYSKSPVLFAGKQWGGFFFPEALTISLYLHGVIADNNTTKKIGFELAQAILYSEVISFPIKAAVGRSRPIVNRGSSDFHFFSPFNSPHNSFPAGHVDCAFAVSTVLSQNANSRILQVLAYVPAALCATERIYQGEHWASDCLFGAALGTCTGMFVVKLHEKKDSKVQISSVYPLQMKIKLN